MSLGFFVFLFDFGGTGLGFFLTPTQYYTLRPESTTHISNIFLPMTDQTCFRQTRDLTQTLFKLNAADRREKKNAFPYAAAR